MYKRYIKRFLDLVLSIVALIVLGIPMLVIALIVKLDVGKPILFTQKRIGKDNKEFRMYKFRSMTDARDKNGVYLPDPDRITKFGHFIRVTSIDELPSLLNVIKGDMSIIGDGVIIGINKKKLYLCGFAAIESSFFFRLF